MNERKNILKSKNWATARQSRRKKGYRRPKSSNTLLESSNKPLGSSNTTLESNNKPLESNNTTLGSSNKPLGSHNKPLGSSHPPTPRDPYPRKGIKRKMGDGQ